MKLKRVKTISGDTQIEPVNNCDLPMFKHCAGDGWCSDGDFNDVLLVLKAHWVEVKFITGEINANRDRIQTK